MANDLGKNKKRTGLGRGLEAILQSPETDIASAEIADNYVVGAVAEMNIDFIEANPFQPRTDFDELALTELAASIKTQGVIQPVTVRKIAYNRYQLISGERRLRASKLAGLQTIPVFVRLANDEQMLEMALIENIHRENLNAIEVAISYQRLIDECSITQDKLSEKIGKSRSAIANYLRLLKLPPEIQVALRDGHITMGHARALISIEDPEQQLLILQQIVEKDLNVRQVEALAREILKPKAQKEAKQQNFVPEHIKQQTNLLAKKLNTKVDIRRKMNGKGNLIIIFQDDADFARLIELIQKD